MTMIEIIFLVVGLVLAIAILFFFFASEIMYRICLKRENIATRIISKVTYKNLHKYKFDFSWWNSVVVKKIYLTNKDNLKLCGKVIENNTSKFAIVVHGYGANSSEMQLFAKMFYDFGFSVVAPDNRGHGDSEGKTITMGYYDKFDIQEWIEYINKNYNNPEIVVFGLSMGGATVCMLSGLELPPNVKAIVSDCAYTSAYDIFREVQNKSIIFSIIPLMHLFDLYSKKRAKFSIREANALIAVAQTKTPILFIHGSRDSFVPFYMQTLLYDATPEHLRDKFVVKGVGHAECLPSAETEYKDKVKEFLQKHIDF